PAVLALAAMAGVTAMTVARPPRVAIVTTGDEVGGGGAAGIVDSNGPFLGGFCAALGLECTRTHAEDDADALRRVLAGHAAEIVVTTGGVSAGDRDLVPRIAAELGFGTIFHQVAMQPGKPVLLARRGERFLVGLPGNPVSVLATAHLVLLPLLQRLMGRGASPWLELPLAVPWQHRGLRQLFLPARLVPGGIAPVRWNGSGDLIAAAAADGLVDLAPGSDHAAGAMVRFLPYVGQTIGERGVMPERVGRG
ncbi:MAG: molybdopterin molybdenumtransferase MoeA, partial [Planctomycetes bacterium]|nr:molybdopterin molybdenumtransferase MoeA [Planctomycetota bacterium]